RLSRSPAAANPPEPLIPTLAPLSVKVHRISPDRSGKPRGGAGFLVASGELYGCFHVVVRAGRVEQPVRAALEDTESRLGRQVAAAPADEVVLQGAAHAVVG